MRAKLLVIAAVALLGSIPPASSNSVGFIYSGDSYTTFTVPGATNTQAFGINNAGEIAGNVAERAT